MTNKCKLLLYVLAAFGAAVPSSAAFADSLFVQCDSQTYYVISCGQNGCSVIDTYPRPREIGDD